MSGMELVTAAPASAGGVVDILSPTFGNNCANHQGSRTNGVTTAGTGTATGNLVGLPVASPLNQCGGADPLPFFLEKPINGGPAIWNSIVHASDDLV